MVRMGWDTLPTFEMDIDSTFLVKVKEVHLNFPVYVEYNVCEMSSNC